MAQNTPQHSRAQRPFRRAYMTIDGAKVNALLRGEVKLSTFRVYATIYGHANDLWLAWPSQARIKLSTGLSERAIRVALVDLVDREWIEEHSRTPGGVVRWQLLEGSLPPALQCHPGTPVPTPRHSSAAPPGTGVPTEREAIERQAINVEPSRKRSEESSEAFALWWSLWPHKKGKGQARKAYAKALKITDPTTLYGALEKQLAHLKDQKVRGFCPHPATWLNGERWEDEPDGPVVSDRFSELDPDDWTGR